MENDDFFRDEDAIRKIEIEKVFLENWIVMDPGSYSINLDGSVDINGSIKFAENMSFLKELPLQFNTVSGDFDCSKLSLISLKGSPTEVGGKFNCSYNQLSSLEYLPKIAGCFEFDNTVKSLYTGGLNCNFDRVVLNYITDKPGNLSEEIVRCSKSLDVIFKYQNYYGIWDDDKVLNEDVFAVLINDIDEDLQ